MEDDYLPLYEVVDHANKDNPNGIAKNSAYERLLKDANSAEEEYQLPQSDTSYVRYPAYSETATEIQKLKQNSRHLKMTFLIGGVVMFMILIITICIFAGMWIRFGRNLAHMQIKEMDNNVMHGNSNTKHPENDQGNLTEQINHVQRTLMEQIEHVQRNLTEQIDVLSEANRAPGFQGNFQNCSQETTACNFTYYNYSSMDSRTWLYCNTPNLQTNKRNYYTLDVQCNHNFDPIQNSVLSSSIVTVSDNTEVFCRCSMVQPTIIGHTTLPLPNVTPNCILIIMRCPVF